MSFQFSNSIPVQQSVRHLKTSESFQSFSHRQDSLRHPRSSESIQSFTSRRHLLGSHKRDVGNVPTLYNVETKQPLPARALKHSWSDSSTEILSPSLHSRSFQFPNLPLWWTSFLAVVPVLAFTATFVVLVGVHRVSKDQTSPFDEVGSPKTDRSAILVHFSSTRLVFVAGFGSTIAPMLLGSLMALWHYPTSRKMAQLSSQGEPNKLPTPQQLSILIGLSAGSLDELRKYFLYRCRRLRAKEATLLTRSAFILFCSALTTGLVLLADVGIHNFTSTVPLSLAIVESKPVGSYGRGIGAHCVDFDRALNQGLPCTVVADASVGANAIAFDSGEIISMQTNRSKTNSAWQLQDNLDPDRDLMLLVPQTSLLDHGQDFVASTIAVSTQCLPLTRQCDVRLNGGAGQTDTYVLFNCTDNFRGALGAPEALAADTISWTRTDATTPDFNFKLDRNFQYAYFADAALSSPYNSIGGVPGSGMDSSSENAMPDADLLTTYHLAVAGLVPVQNNADGQALLNDPAALPVGGSLIAYTLNCSVTAFNINYTWSNNEIRDFTRVPTANGSILELAHGMQAVGMPSLSQAQSLASLTANMAEFARAYANLHSQDAVALIASVMTPRANLIEARRSDLLVAKIPLWAFIALVSCNTIFVLFALVLAVRALTISSPETRDMVAKLSVEGLAAAAFEDRGGKQDPGPIVTDIDDMFEESRIGGASRRIALRKATGGTVALRIEQPHL